MNPFIAEVGWWGGNFAPRTWAFCNGQLLAIASNTALFSLIGCTFGGDCRTSMALPDLRGRVTIGEGTGPGLSPYQWGQRGGQEDVVLTVLTMPSHTHFVQPKYSNAPSVNTPENNFIGQLPPGSNHVGTIASGYMGGAKVTNTGGTQSHDNMSPYLNTSHIIALFGVYPSRA